MIARFIWAIFWLFCLVLTDCRSRTDVTDFLGRGDGAEPKLAYVLSEFECASCIERLKPFVELMSREQDFLVQRLVVISPELTDRQGFGSLLGLEARCVASADFFNPSGRGKPGVPMMYLLSGSDEIIFARPISFIGHDLECLRDEIVQLGHEFAE